MSPRTSTPAQRGRSRVADAVRQRGQSPYNLWLLRPPLDTQDVIVNSDPKMELFYFLEGDPSLDLIDYQPLRHSRVTAPVQGHKRIRSGPEHFADVISAGVSGRVFWGGASRARPNALAPSDRYVTLADLDAHRMRIDNWRRIVPAIRRIRAFPTMTVEREFLQQVGAYASLPVSAALSALDRHPPAMVLGVIGMLLRQRKLQADVERRPWSLHTQLFMEVRP